MTYVGKIIQDLLTMIYEHGGISILVSLLFLIVWQTAEEITWKQVWKGFLKQLNQKIWQKRLIMILYMVFVLQRTVFNRSPWGNPLENVLGFWGVMIGGEPNYDMFENVLLFVPLYPLVRLSGLEQNAKHINKIGYLNIIIMPLQVSLVIESIQLLFRMGTFQLSDLVYNCIGGFTGGVLYLCYKLVHKNLRRLQN